MYKPFIKLLSLVFTIFYYNIGATQVVEETSLTADHQPRLSGEMIYFSESTRGSQYLLDNWVVGEITLASGDKVYYKNLNYNGYLDELIWVHPDYFRHIVIDRNNVKEFTLEYNHTRFYFTNLGLNEESDSKSFNFYAEILYSGNIKLYVHRQISKIGSDYFIHNKQRISRPKVGPTPVFYIDIPGSEMVTINKLSRRNLLLAFPDHRQELRQELRNNRIILSDEDALIRAMPILERILSNHIDR
jgi:hypothetical protein